MVRKARVTETETVQAQDVETLPVIESEIDFEFDSDSYADSDVDDNADSDSADDGIEVVETVIVQVNTPTADDGLYCLDLQALTLKLIKLEDRFTKLETELSTHINKQGKVKVKGMAKEKKVKCKCKGKKVLLSKCKCKSKKATK